jgi:hypothetical protein
MEVEVNCKSFEWECVLGKGGFGRVKAAVKKVSNAGVSHVR